MVHLSGGAVSAIIFGSMLFVFVSVSLLLWWRRVHKDLYSNDPNFWGGSWGAKAQAELQERIDRQNAERWAAEEAERNRLHAEEASRQETWRDIEAQAMQSGRDSDHHYDGTEGTEAIPLGAVGTETVVGKTDTVKQTAS